MVELKLARSELSSRDQNISPSVFRSCQPTPPPSSSVLIRFFTLERSFSFVEGLRFPRSSLPLSHSTVARALSAPHKHPAAFVHLSQKIVPNRLRSALVLLAGDRTSLMPTTSSGQTSVLASFSSPPAPVHDAMILAQFQLVVKCSPSFVTESHISSVFGMISSMSFQFSTQACKSAAYSLTEQISILPCFTSRTLCSAFTAPSKRAPSVAGSSAFPFLSTTNRSNLDGEPAPFAPVTSWSASKCFPRINPAQETRPAPVHLLWFSPTQAHPPSH